MLKAMVKRRNPPPIVKEATEIPKKLSNIWPTIKLVRIVIVQAVAHVFVTLLMFRFLWFLVKPKKTGMAPKGLIMDIRVIENLRTSL